MRDDPLFVAKTTMVLGLALAVAFVAVYLFGLFAPSAGLDAALSLPVGGVFLFSGFSWMASRGPVVGQVVWFVILSGLTVFSLFYAAAVSAGIFAACALAVAIFAVVVSRRSRRCPTRAVRHL